MDRRGFIKAVVSTGILAGCGGRQPQPVELQPPDVAAMPPAGTQPQAATPPPPPEPAPAPPIVFSILHTNDLHSHFFGVGPVRDYRPDRADPDDKTIGGYARLATLIRERKRALEAQGPVLVLDAGDFTMGTALGAASRVTGAELQAMAQMGYDATTLGDHEFDFGPGGVGQIIRTGLDPGPVPPVLIANVRFDARGESLGELRRLVNEKIIRPYLVIARGGHRFGIFGVIGYDAQKSIVDPGAVRFEDPVETARALARKLREEERVDVVICLSHGGVQRAADGSFGGEDLRLAEAVPAIDVVVGGHTHTPLETPLTTTRGAPVVQALCYGQRLGELVVSLDRGTRRVVAHRLHVVDARIPGDGAIIQTTGLAVAKANLRLFIGLGHEVLQPLAVVPQDLPSSSSDLAASAPLANLVTDAVRYATGADIGFILNGALLAGLIKGKTGVQTVHDVFAVAPFGFGIVDPAAGGALVTAYYTGRELKNIMEFFLAGDGVVPGRYFPRVSGARVQYAAARPRYDRVTGIELGDVGTRYRTIDMTAGAEARLFGLSCNTHVGLLLLAVPILSRGQLQLAPKNSVGAPLAFRVNVIDDPRTSPGPYVTPPRGELDPAAIDNPKQSGEIKEWQAIVSYLRRLPDKNPEGLALVRADNRLMENRVVSVG